MQDLPDRPGMVTVLLEQLRKSDRIGNGLPEVGTQVPCRIESGRRPVISERRDGLQTAN